MGRKKVVKKESVSPIYENAIDSLRIGMGFFLKDAGYSSRKHAILTVFHAIELMLKERLAIASSLKFILFFVEFVFKRKLDGVIESKLLRDINHRVFEYNESNGLAEFRFNQWAKTEWPDWNEEEEDIPEEFGGTLRCPECRQDWLVMGYHDKPVCFWCNTTVDADCCEDCGEVFIVG